MLRKELCKTGNMFSGYISEKQKENFTIIELDKIANTVEGNFMFSDGDIF